MYFEKYSNEHFIQIDIDKIFKVNWILHTGNETIHQGSSKLIRFVLTLSNVTKIKDLHP